MITAQEAFDLAIKCEIPELTRHCLEQIYKHIRYKASNGDFSFTTTLDSVCLGLDNSEYHTKSLKILKSLNSTSASILLHKIITDLESNGFSVDSVNKYIFTPSVNTEEFINGEIEIFWKLK